jgi:choline/glycine/proline betaine transport protein
MQNWVLKNKKGDKIIDLNPLVFGVSATVIFVFVTVSIVFLDQMSAIFDSTQAWIANQTGWVFVLATNIILGYCVYMMFGRFGSIRLGGPDAKTDFTLIGWFAMLFSAGMGIGLLFYSVAEPMYHLVMPPHGVEPGTVAAYKDAMQTTFLHWGLHAWGVYALVGLALAYFAFNRNAPLSMRGLFEPLLGERIYGPWGHAIDILATVATLFGVATSLGLGVSQINAGLNHIFDVPQAPWLQVLLIAGITAIATFSVVAGVDKGIRRLSELNMVVAALLLLFVLLVGPTLFVFNAFVENIGNYLNDFFALAFWNETYTGGSWQNGWTVFYWGWWIAWSPFVGLFIARISRGRTIREFVMGVLFVPTLMTFLWLTIFGDTAMYFELFGSGGIADAVQEDLSNSLFVFLDRLPLSVMTGTIATAMATLAGVIALVVIVTFFVTSSDSGSLVIDIITAGGKTNPPVAQRVFWAVTEGVVAAALLVGGGLTALQTAAITTGLPFALLLLVMIYSLQKALAADEVTNRSATRPQEGSR